MHISSLTTGTHQELRKFVNWTWGTREFRVFPNENVEEFFLFRVCLLVST